LLDYAEVPRSSFYAILKQLSKSDKYATIKAKIIEINAENKGRYGYRRMTNVLKSAGFTINHKTVLKLMRELGLLSKVRMKKYVSYRGDVGKIAPNLLERDFTCLFDYIFFVDSLSMI
jgi:putative transposase